MNWQVHSGGIDFYYVLGAHVLLHILTKCDKFEL